MAPAWGEAVSGASVVAATQVAVEKSRFPGLGPRAYCLLIDGDGLAPKFAKGDLVIVDPDRIPQPGDFVVLYGDAKIAALGDHDGHPGLFHAIVSSIPAPSAPTDGEGTCAPRSRLPRQAPPDY